MKMETDKKIKIANYEWHSFKQFFIKPYNIIDIIKYILIYFYDLISLGSE